MISVVLDDAPGFEVEVERAPGLEAALVFDVLGRDRESADLGAHDDAAVLRDDVPRGSQAVAIQHRADPASVGVRDGRRAVPRLHHAGVELVERAAVRVHLRLVLPGLGDHHHHRVTEVAAREVEELERVVELRRIEAPRDITGKSFFRSSPKSCARERALARVHPVRVAAQRVDLAVVREIAERLRQLPGREGVGAVALVDEREARFDVGIREVREELRRLVREEHALVDERSGSQARHVEVHATGEHLVLDHTADDVQLAVEGVLIEAVRRADEDLLDRRQARAGDPPDRVGVCRNVAPAEERLTFRGDRLSEDFPLPRALGHVGGEEDEPCRVAAELRQLEARFVCDAAQELVGRLHEQSRAVARGLVRASCTTMCKATQDGRPHLDDVVGRSASQVGDETDPACVVFERGVVEALFRG